MVYGKHAQSSRNIQAKSVEWAGIEQPEQAETVDRCLHPNLSATFSLRMKLVVRSDSRFPALGLNRGGCDKCLGAVNGSRCTVSNFSRASGLV